jgi:hypothetical protein
MDRARSLPLFSQKVGLPLFGQLPPALDFLAGKILLFIQNTKQFPRQPDMLTVRLLSLVIRSAGHGASFKH